jgi:hypothetical protein
VKGKTDSRLEEGITALSNAGQPVITIQIDDLLDIGQEFFRWEVATAYVGAILGINPFNQPNVQESKDNTNRLLARVREEGRLLEEKPALEKEPLSFFTQEKYASAMEMLRTFFAQAHPGDYMALLAYLPEVPSTDRVLKTIQAELRDGLRIATTQGYGPRYLHSTGQYHKGGPKTGLFLELTASESLRVPIPRQPYTFGVFERAQALGDLEALRKHGQRAMRIDLGSNIQAGLLALKEMIEAAIQSG